MAFTKALLWSICLFAGSICWGQSWRQAVALPDHSIHVIDQPAPKLLFPRGNGFPELPGFPKGFPANPNLKNVRNITLADLNGDGTDDILMPAFDKLFAFSADSLLWVKQLEGSTWYPPSVADVDGNGSPDIVQPTGGSQQPGRLYLLDANGNDWPGWPLSFDDHWMMTAAALSDLDDDGRMEIIANELVGAAGRVHAILLDGSPINDNWPVTLDRRPAVTPSVGDLDQDGEPEIVVHSTGSRYVFGLDGQPKPGFPIVTQPAQRYSYQSPILTDLDGDNYVDIIGATHGDNTAPDPEFYVMDYSGNDLSGWPVPTPDQAWTYSTPTVINLNGQTVVFMSMPNGTTEAPVVFAWDKQGQLLPGFPIVKAGGLEGIISVADVDNDNVLELVFGSNLIDPDGQGFVHAYEMDGSGEVPGWPIQLKGWTYLNGAAPSDVNGDGRMDLTVLTYTQHFGASTDSVFLHVFDLGIPYSPDKVAWNTYKGSPEHSGYFPSLVPSRVDQPVFDDQLTCFPNPAADEITFRWETATGPVHISLFDQLGQNVALSRKSVSEKENALTLNIHYLPAGLYYALMQTDQQVSVIHFIKQ